jgi:hypothetical protein
MATPATPIGSMPTGSDLAPTDLDDDDKTLLGPPVNWPADRVKAFHKIVYETTISTMVVPQCLPHSAIAPKISAVPLNLTQSIVLDAPPPSTPPSPGINSVTSDSGLSHRVIELWVNLACLDEQIKEAGESATPESTAVAAMLRKAAQQHAFGWDSVYLNGFNAYANPSFLGNMGFHQNQQPTDGGLMGLTLVPSGSTPYTIFSGANGFSNPYQYPAPVLTVLPLGSASGIPGLIWGVNSLPACASMIAYLTTNFNPGPFALLVRPEVYAEFFAPAGPESLAITYDRISPLFKAGVFATNALPSVAATATAPGYYGGVIVSVGANAVSLLVGQVAKLRHMYRDPTGYHRLRITGRSVLQVSDVNAVGQILWQVPAP